MLARVLRSGVFHVLFAFVAMGGWAAYANSEHGASPAASAFLTQGAASALITALMKRAIEGLHIVLVQRGLPRLLAPAGVCAVAASSLLLFHLGAGTPDVAQTVAVPLTVSTTYAFVYALSLKTDGRQARP